MKHEEDWRPIPIAPGYMASSHGRIVGLRRGPLKLRMSVHGYMVCTPYHNGVGTGRTAHALVASAFIGPRPDGLCINHKNGVKSDNRPENLEYVTQAENVRHAHQTGLSTTRGEGHPMHRLTESDVRNIRELLRSGMSEKRIATAHGVTQCHVSRIKLNRAWKHVA